MKGLHTTIAAAAAAAAIAAASTFAPQPRAQAHAPLGTNVARVDDWNPEYAFVDAFRQSRPWISGTATAFDDRRSLDLDEHGWVRSLQAGQIARTLMFSAVPQHYPSGVYVVTYEGAGTIQWSPNVRIVQSSPGRLAIDVDSGRGNLVLNITATSPQNYLRNIHVYMPGANPADVFNPSFLESLAGYRAIRFMNWQATDGNWSVSTPTLQRTWADRPTLDDARWSFMRGVPIEIMCALANRLNVDAWFSMPHPADDDYMRRFAQTVNALLNPNLKVYVEYSDEVWNGSYAQAPYAQQRGLALGLSADPFQAQMRYHSLRSRQIFGIFEQVFPPSRLVRVLSSQAGNPWVSSTVLNFSDTRLHTDVLAIAPYLDIRPPEQSKIVTQHMTLDQLFNELNTVVAPQVAGMVKMHADIAHTAGVGLAAYEGGQSLVALGNMQGDPWLNGLYDAANRDARMGPLYARMLQDWSGVAGGAVYMHFTNCSRWDQYGRFGALEWLEQPRSQAPKYDALLTWMGR